MGWTKRERRFWTKAQRGRPKACWPWLGGTANGAGIFWDGGKLRPATHVAWELTYGALPPDGRVYHTCACRGCVNPKHLAARKHPGPIAARRE
jgi:predicted NBD/HSP70 family sugar kinase